MALLKIIAVLPFFVAFAYADLAVAETRLADGAQVFVLDKPGSASEKLEVVHRFGKNFDDFDDDVYRRGRFFGRIPAPDFPKDPIPLPPIPPGPCNMPTVVVVADPKKCRPKIFFAQWVQVKVLTECFTKTYFVRWKFCYIKKVAEIRASLFAKCVLFGIKRRCHKIEEGLTCPTSVIDKVIMKCSRWQPTEVIEPKID